MFEQAARIRPLRFTLRTLLVALTFSCLVAGAARLFGVEVVGRVFWCALLIGHFLYPFFHGGRAILRALRGKEIDLSDFRGGF